MPFYNILLSSECAFVALLWLTIMLYIHHHCDITIIHNTGIFITKLTHQITFKFLKFVNT